ncbi:hypothetical protein [Phaffia rhodozyma]|uniref:Uncharacterized protein n=1 Tax=Phaffia rhodozyma TaxID=264483 RepID=A0A0F7SKN7_PHARH|nr:hypothetical protein [Phaffia rhodozyma]
MSNPIESTTTTTSSTSNNTANSISNAVKSGWNVFHGAGEVIRGSINSAADGLGDGIAGRSSTTTTTTTTTTGATNADAGLETQSKSNTFASGKEEINRGLNAFK